MDGFGDDFVPLEKPTNDVDPAAEFLAREQNELAGLDDDISPNPSSSSGIATTGTGNITANGALENDFFGNIPPSIEQEGEEPDPFTELAIGKEGLSGAQGQGSFSPSWGFEEEAKNSESFPSPPEVEIEDEEEFPPSETVDPAPGSLIRGETSDTGLYEVEEPARSPIPTLVREEPEKIRIWREEQEKRLMEKDAAEERAKEELRLKAKRELEEWYKQHEEQVTKTRQANRSAEKELVADTSAMEPGTEWERISKLCDFNPKTAKSSRDISRMRSIILQVKQNPPLKA